MNARRRSNRKGRTALWAYQALGQASTGSSVRDDMNTVSAEDVALAEKFMKESSLKRGSAAQRQADDYAPSDRSAEKKVLAAFLEQGLRDALDEIDYIPQPGKTCFKKDALNWMLMEGLCKVDSADKEDKKRLFSFLGVCEALDIADRHIEYWLDLAHQMVGIYETAVIKLRKGETDRLTVPSLMTFRIRD